MYGPYISRPGSKRGKIKQLESIIGQEKKKNKELEQENVNYHKKYTDSESKISKLEKENANSLSFDEILFDENWDVLSEIKKICNRLVGNNTKDNKIKQISSFSNIVSGIIEQENIIDSGDWYDAGSPGRDESMSHMAIQDLGTMISGWEMEISDRIKSGEYNFTENDFKNLIKLTSQLKLSEKKILNVFGVSLNPERFTDDYLKELEKRIAKYIANEFDYYSPQKKK